MRSMSAMLLWLAGCDVFFPLTGPAPIVDAPVDAPPAPVCFVDDFDVLDPRWMRLEENGISVAVQNSGLDIVLPAGAVESSFNGLGAPFVGLSETSIEVEIVMPPYQGAVDPGNVSVNFSLDANKKRYEMFATGGVLFTRFGDVDNMLDESFLFDRETHRHWRIRNTGALAFFETSPDGETWKIRREVPIAEPLEQGFVSLFAATFSGGVSEPGIATLDHFVIRGECM